MHTHHFILYSSHTLARQSLSLTAVYLREMSFVLRLIVEHDNTLVSFVIDSLDFGEVDHPVVPLDEYQVARFEGKRYMSVSRRSTWSSLRYRLSTVRHLSPSVRTESTN